MYITFHILLKKIVNFRINHEHLSSTSQEHIVINIYIIE